MKTTYLGKYRFHWGKSIFYEAVVDSMPLCVSLIKREYNPLYMVYLEKLDKLPYSFQMNDISIDTTYYQRIAVQTNSGLTINRDELETELSEAKNMINSISVYLARLNRLKELLSEENERLNDNTKAN